MAYLRKHIYLCHRTIIKRVSFPGRNVSELKKKFWTVKAKEHHIPMYQEISGLEVF